MILVLASQFRVYLLSDCEKRLWNRWIVCSTTIPTSSGDSAAGGASPCCRSPRPPPACWGGAARASPGGTAQWCRPGRRRSPWSPAAGSCWWFPAARRPWLEMSTKFWEISQYSLHIHYYLVVYSERTEHVQYTFSKNCENRKLQRNFVATPLEMVKLSRVEDIIYTVLELVIGCCVIMVTLAPFPFFFILQLYWAAPPPRPANKS